MNGSRLPSLKLSILFILVAACEPVPPPRSFSPDQTSYMPVAAPENTSFLRVTRYSSRVLVPLGRTREELTATLEQAARTLADQTGADAVMVFAYRQGDKPSGAYTAGRAIYAPNGRWDEAGEDGPMQVIVELNDLYFAPPAARASAGDTVTLKSTLLDSVALSREYGSWSDDDIVARVPNGARVVVLDTRSEPVVNEELIRYRVRTLDPAALHEGWVHKWDVP